MGRPVFLQGEASGGPWTCPLLQWVGPAVSTLFAAGDVEPAGIGRRPFVNQNRLITRHGLVPAAALASLLFTTVAAPAIGATQEQEGQETEEQPGETEETPDPADFIPRFTDQVVVSASRVEQEIVNAPAAIAVIPTEVIETQAASNFGDLLRQAPGVNVTQLSSTHYSVTSRGSSSALATSQLVLVDGRSVYQDFFGFTSWDFLSVGLDDLERIEVVNGPASAIWGANAMSGVVNLITKAPRDTLGTSLNLRFGSFDRNVTGNPMDPGNQLMGSLTHAQAVNDRFAYRATVSFTRHDPLPRPSGEIPNDTGTLYPPLQGVTARDAEGGSASRLGRSRRPGRIPLLGRLRGEHGDPPLRNRPLQRPERGEHVVWPGPVRTRFHGDRGLPEPDLRGLRLPAFARPHRRVSRRDDQDEHLRPQFQGHPVPGRTAICSATAPAPAS